MSTTDRPLFGRDDELGRLADELDAVHSAGRVIRLVGDPGVGKSALQAAVARTAGASGFTVLSARGSQAESHLPFAALHQLLQPVLAGAERLPAKLRDAVLSCFGMSDAEVNPFFVSLAVLEMVVECSSSTPALLCLDDLQWMDQPSIDTLSFVARRIAGERIVVMYTTRPDSLELLPGQPVTTIALTSLDESAAVALVRSRAPHLPPMLQERVLRHAVGNPLALVEFASALESGRPGSTLLDEDLPMTARLEQTFVARADELGPVVRTVLDVAALDDGEDIGSVLAAARIVSDAPVEFDSLPPAVDSGLLAITGNTYRIGHPLVTSALRHAMSVAERRRHHAALAQVLSADEPQRAVWHRAAAASAPDELIAAALDAAAEDARRRGAMSTARAWFERAAALSPDPEGQASRLLSAAEIGYELGRFVEVEQVAATLSRMQLSVRQRSRLTWLEGVFHDGSTSEPAEILHLVELARRSADDGDADLALQLMFGAARRVWWRDPGQKVRNEIVQAVDTVAVQRNDPRVLAVLALSESTVSSTIVAAGLEDWPVDAGGRPDLAGLLGIAAFGIGDHARAASHLSAAIEALRAQGRMSLLAEALAIRAWTEINLGLFDASTSADEAMRLAEETGQSVWAATARVAVAVIDAVCAGSAMRADLLVHAEQTALRMPNASSSILAGVQLARGIAALGADHPEPAFGELHRVFVAGDPAHQRVQQLWAISYLADAAVRTRRMGEAGSLLSSMRELTGATPALGPTIALEYSTAVLAGHEEAQEHFLAALDGAALPFPWHRARLELAYGSWLRRQRRVLESRGPLRSARGTFNALGAHPWASRADRELRATGERGWRPTASAWQQLSPQENQIAALAASGLSNREIGEQLFLSHRTVSSHLYRIFPKLGVTSRSQLAGALGEAGDRARSDGPAVI